MGSEEGESTPHNMDIVRGCFFYLCKEAVSRKIQKRDTKYSGSLDKEDASVTEEPYWLQTDNFHSLCPHYPLGILSL